MNDTPKNAKTQTVSPQLVAEGSPIETQEAAPKARHPEPTRYGDWELNGKCVDF